MTDAWSQARSVYGYESWVPECVRRLKYDLEKDRARFMGDLMAPLVAQMGSFDAIVPVPLHPTRQRERGFNQSELLAQVVSKRSGIPVMPLLLRTVLTKPQVNLSRSERIENMRGVFELNPLVSVRPHMRILLVDDVRTTGSTLNSCAETLVLAGASPVCALTFALDA